MPDNNLQLTAKATNIIDNIRESYADAVSNAGEASSAIKRSIASAIRTGAMLCRLKELVGHGNFERTIRQNFEFSVQTARQWMQLSIRQKSGDLTNCTSLHQALIACGIVAETKPKPIGTAEVNIGQVVTQRAQSKLKATLKTLEGIDLVELDGESRMAILDTVNLFCNWYLNHTQPESNTISVSSEVLANTGRIETGIPNTGEGE